MLVQHDLFIPLLIESNTIQTAQHKFARQFICIGINEVTRALERDELSLILICRYVPRSCLTNKQEGLRVEQRLE